MGYDVIDYETQCKKIRAQAIADGIAFNPVSGVPKGTKILPVCFMWVKSRGTVQGSSMTCLIFRRTGRSGQSVTYPTIRCISWMPGI